MTVQLMNPDGSVINPLYHHVAIATGNTLIYLAGQVAWDEHGQLVAPGDLASQIAQVYRTVAKGLVAAGATFHDVVRITWYAANWERSVYEDFAAGAEQAARKFDMPRPPVALIGVGTIFEAGILIEAEVTAVIDRMDPAQTPKAVTE